MFGIKNFRKTLIKPKWGLLKANCENRGCRMCRYFFSLSYDVYKEHYCFSDIEKKSPDEIINILKNMNKEKKNDFELMQCISNHLFDFSDDYFCPQIMKVLEQFAKLRYSDETLLGFVCHRIDDLMSLKSSLRINTLLHICKQLNFHHFVITNPILEQLNDTIYNYRYELINILKNISYLYIDPNTCSTLMNHIVLNKDMYEKQMFVLFEAFSRLENESNICSDLILEQVKTVEKANSFVDLKNCIKFFSGHKRLGLPETTYIHLEFQKKINKIKLLQPNNISYMLLLMISSKWSDRFLMEHIMMHIENFVNNSLELVSAQKYNLLFSLSDDFENTDDRKRIGFTSYDLKLHENRKETIKNTKELVENKMCKYICNEYILHFLPFHLLLLVLLNYENKNTLIYLLQICIDEYISFYDVRNIIHLIYVTTLLIVQDEGKNQEMENKIKTLFLNIQSAYKKANINEYKILYDCFLFHENILKNDRKLNSFYKDLLINECYSTLPSCPSKLNFEDMEIIKCGSCMYLKQKKENIIFVYVNKNDFYSTSKYVYDTLLLSVKFRIELLKKRYSASSSIQVMYNGKPLLFLQKL